VPVISVCGPHGGVVFFRPMIFSSSCCPRRGHAFVADAIFWSLLRVCLVPSRAGHAGRSFLRPVVFELRSSLYPPAATNPVHCSGF